jgi:3-keto-5-aminohexanoate cleavage enzyme
MEKLIITVACDSSRSYPENTNMPGRRDVEAIAAEYVGAFVAGASVCHHHGVVEIDPPSADGAHPAMRIDFDGWEHLTRLIRAECPDVVIQYGIAGISLDAKRILMAQRPEMMSTPFGPHDCVFQSQPGSEPFEIYYSYQRSLLADVAAASNEAGVKIEAESFGVGYFWNIGFLRERGLLPDPAWVTLFFGWKGANWVPPTLDSLTYMVSHLPPAAVWGVSVQDPTAAWPLLAAAIGSGGHVRVGWEDNPYLPDGSLAASNRELVEVVVSIAQALGRPVATPLEARQIIGLSSASPAPGNGAVEEMPAAVARAAKPTSTRDGGETQ